MQEVELLPPSSKDLQFSKFLKNGKRLMTNHSHLSYFITFPSAFYNANGIFCRVLVTCKGDSRDILCDAGCFSGCKARLNAYGCVSSMLTGLVDFITAC